MQSLAPRAEDTGTARRSDLWDVARPARPARAPGVTMAGFRGRPGVAFDLRAVPHSDVMVVVEFGAGRLVVDHAAGRERQGNIVAGLAFGTTHARGEGIECLQVRLSPPVAHAVLGGATVGLGHAVANLADVWGPEADRLRERLHAARRWEERFALVEDLVLRRYEAGPAVDPEVAHAWERIAASRGRARVGDLVAETGWSRSRLWSRFRSQIGLSPKRAARLVRFDLAARHLAAGHGAARVAAEAGYADQSHLHRDVVAFTGVTPTAVAGAPWLAVDDLAWPEQQSFFQGPGDRAP